MSQIAALLLNFVAPGVWSASELSLGEIELADAQGKTLLQVDFSGVTDKSAMMNALGRDLNLPDYFGKNFDALEECLGELGDQSLVVLAHGDGLISGDPKTVKTLNYLFADDAGTSYVWVGASDPEVPVIPQFWTQL